MRFGSGWVYDNMWKDAVYSFSFRALNEELKPNNSLMSFVQSFSLRATHQIPFWQRSCLLEGVESVESVFSFSELEPETVSERELVANAESFSPAT